MSDVFDTPLQSAKKIFDGHMHHRHIQHNIIYLKTTQLYNLVNEAQNRHNWNLHVHMTSQPSGSSAGIVQVSAYL